MEHATLAPDLVAAPVTLDDLPGLRDVVTRVARRHGLARDSLVDLVIAVNEVTTNAVTHGSMPAHLLMWRADGHLVVEVRDSGRWKDPGAGGYAEGHEAPPDDAPGGRGLWLARRAATDLDIRRSAEGTTIRMTFALP
ncbi:ATP-binding protein [Nonomuraea sp. NPDC050310]|uniref:ATP-binding protein n=1 Tax=unclassified Nonomuraea TaxID=2593643 RepID=UPI00340793A9